MASIEFVAPVESVLLKLTSEELSALDKLLGNLTTDVVQTLGLTEDEDNLLDGIFEVL